MKLIALLAVLFLSKVLAVDGGLKGYYRDEHGNHYGYEDDENGPSHWQGFNKQCGGREQSPINIPAQSTFKGTLDGVIPSFDFEQEAATSNLEFVHKGHTVEVDLRDHQRFSLAGEDYLTFITDRSNQVAGNDFILEQFHFHWGANENHGSEHSFDGHFMPLEMHMVHFNAALADNVTQALQYRNGLLVIAVVFEDSEQEVSNSDTVLEPLVEIMRSPDFTVNRRVELESFDLLDLVGDLDTSNFYLYPGSLTTPPCTESVTWVVLKDRLRVSEQTMDAFRNCTDPDGDKIRRNFRPIQNGNQRKIFDSETQRWAVIEKTSENDDFTEKSAVAVTVVVVFLAVAIAVVALLTLKK